MKIKELKTSEILTTKDFPVYNTHILKIYFRICKKGPKEILPKFMIDYYAKKNDKKSN